jgi:hypothetical protein
MAILTESIVRERANKEILKKNKSSTKILTESSFVFDHAIMYDVFLSHSVKDSELILGIKCIIEDLNYKVYVDWIDDPQLDRSTVSKKTAEILKDRMSSSHSLFFVTTENAAYSKWMPWECGYFDGIKQKVAIVPIKKESSNNEYVGQEYLGLYPYVIKEKSDAGIDKLWIHINKTCYSSYDHWVKTHNNLINWKK